MKLTKRWSLMITLAVERVIGSVENVGALNFMPVRAT